VARPIFLLFRDEKLLEVLRVVKYYLIAVLKKFIEKVVIVNKTLLLFLISIGFAVFVGSGGYGFGFDFYTAYYKPNVISGDFREQLGWSISTLYVYNLHIGVYVTSFILAISTGSLLQKTTSYYFKNNNWLFFLLFISLIHTWPIIMSTSNAMRQGLSMSFLFLAIYFILSGRTRWSIFMVILTALAHKSGVLFSLVFIGLILYNNLLYIFNRYQNKILVFPGLLLFSSIFFLLSVYFPDKEVSGNIAGDFRYPFLFINTVFIFIHIRYLKKRADFLDDFMLLTSFVLPAFLFQGFDWEFERLNMVVLIPYIISFSRVFSLRGKRVVLFSLIVSLLLATMYTGMYSKALV
jgi:hypothetical protein